MNWVFCLNKGLKPLACELNCVTPKNMRRHESFSQNINEIKRQRRNAVLAHLPHANIVRIEGKPSYDIAPGNPPQHVIIVEKVGYPIAAFYWRWLRAKCERVAVYTLKDWYPPLALTVEPLGITLPTGDEKLKRAVGVGDDGEIIYSDETTIPKES